MAPPAGALVATVGDLTAVGTQVHEKIDENRRWVEHELDKLGTRAKDLFDQTDASIKQNNMDIAAFPAQIDELKKTKVNLSEFKQQLSTLEMRIESTNSNLEAMIKQVSDDTKTALASAITSMTTKVEATEAGMSSLRDQFHVIENDTIPDLRRQLEDERVKRNAADIRLEKRDEELRESFDTRIQEVMGLLRQDIEDARKKLLEELGTKDSLAALGREIATLKSMYGQEQQDLIDSLAGLKVAFKDHVEATQHSFDKMGKDVTALMKDSTNIQIGLQQHVQATSVEFKSVRDNFKELIAQIRKDLADVRAAAAQAAVNNDKKIEAVASEIPPLKDAKRKIFDDWKTKEVIDIVRDIDGRWVPTISAKVVDLESHYQRLKEDIQSEHDKIERLRLSTDKIRGHFKMFDVIAKGLDEDGDGVPDYAQSDRLPPIKTPR